MIPPGGWATALTPGRCLWCGDRTQPAVPVCTGCRHMLAHACYGKTRLGQKVAQTIARRNTSSGTPTAAYSCPVCADWHVGNHSQGGAASHADAALLCLMLMRWAPDYRAMLAMAWEPCRADRTAWRTALTAQRNRTAATRTAAAPGRTQEVPA